MPRCERIVLPGIPHHVTQRGNNHQPIFLDDEDRYLYVEILKDRCRLYSLQVLGHCLMTNHVHLAVIPGCADSLSKAIGYSHRLFAQKSNIKYARDGHLWENRFHSCPLDEAHFLSVLIYIDQNPVRAGLVTDASLYRWSSARAHSGSNDSAGLIDADSWRRIAADYDWEQAIRMAQDQEVLKELRSHTLSGQPWGSEEFVKGILAERRPL